MFWLQGSRTLVEDIILLIIKHPPSGTGGTSGAVMHDCLGYLPTFDPAGAGHLALIYYELYCRIIRLISVIR